MSEKIFSEMLDYLPRNGPVDQQGLSYFIRDDDLLLVFIHTSWNAGGGEGHIETAWLAETLRQNQDARYKFVAGHHPVFPVNGFTGEGQRTIFAEAGAALWRLLVDHDVTAYLCSHILAFDVQVHDDVLQILTAGAGTAHRMPEEQEYLHYVQMAVDREGLRYQVLDCDGAVREQLIWPAIANVQANWSAVATGIQATSFPDFTPEYMQLWDFSGEFADIASGAPQTLLAAWQEGPWLTNLWIGFTGATRRLTVTVAPWTGRSPHYWFGPEIGAPATGNFAFSVQVGLHAAMGPGGILWRWDERSSWHSLTAASPWGLETLPTLDHWAIGQDKFRSDSRAFSGRKLQVRRLDF